jgi:cobalamin biosynthesis protein CobT
VSLRQDLSVVIGNTLVIEMDESSDAGVYSHRQQYEEDSAESNDDDDTSKGGRSEENDTGETSDDDTSKGGRSHDIDVDNSRSNETDDDNDSESSSTSTDDFVDAPMPNALPNGFNHNLQEPIYIENPFICMSNIFAYSKRFGCIICLQQECQHVVADSKCYNHLITNHHHLVATVENGARKKLSDVVSEIKVESPPLFTDPNAIWQQPHDPEPFVNVMDGFKCV